MSKVNKFSADTISQSLRSTGTATEVLGWALILIAGFYTIVLTTNVAPFIYVLLGGLYFIYTGKYIKYRLGKNIKKVLLANGIISIAYCPGLIPIIVCIDSFRSYSSFKKLTKKDQDKYSKPRSYKIMHHDIVLGVILVVVTIASLFIGNYARNNNLDNVTSSYRSVTSQSSTYSAPKYNFTVEFPGHPAATSLSEKESGYTVPYTYYDSSIDNGNQAFQIYAIAWPTQYFDFSSLSQSALRSSISTSLKGTVNVFNGKNITTSDITFLSVQAEEGQYSVTVSGQTISGYIRVFFIGNHEYVINALGSSKADFERFANSFTYNS